MAVIVLTSGTSWTVPSNWNSASNNIYCIGGGGGAYSGGSSSGGGGAFATLANVALTPNSTVPISIGAGGAASAAGGSTNFNSGQCIAVGGGAGISAAGGAGGAASACTPSATAKSGGAGVRASNGQAGGGGAGGINGAGASGGGASSGGGGGGAGSGGLAGVTASGGPNGNGGAAFDSTPGGAGGNPGGAGSHGSGGGGSALAAGAGGAGIEWTTAGSGGGGGGGNNGGTGGLYGGGGGSGSTAGLGAQGAIVISYTPVTAPPISGNLSPSVALGNPVGLAFIRALTGDLSPSVAFSGALSFVRSFAGNLIPSVDLEGTFQPPNYVTFSGGLTVSTGLSGALERPPDFAGDLAPSVVFAGGSIFAPPHNLSGAIGPSVQLLGSLTPGTIGAKNFTANLVPSVTLGPAALQVTQSILVALPVQGGPPPTITTPTDGAVGIQFKLAYQRTFANIGVQVGTGTLGPVTVALRSYVGGDIPIGLEVVRVRIDLTGATAGQWVWAQIPPVTLTPNKMYILWAQTIANAGYDWYAEYGCTVIGGGVTADDFHAWNAAYGSSITQNQPTTLGATGTQAYGLNMAVLPPIWNLKGDLAPQVALNASALVAVGEMNGDLAPQVQLFGALSRAGVLAGDLPVNVSLAADMVAGPIWEDAPPCPIVPWEEEELCDG